MDKVIISVKSNIPEEKLYTEKVINDLQAENDNLKDDIDKQQLYVDSLEQENEQLKEELRTEKIYSSQIEELEESLQHAKTENEHYRKEAYRLADGLNKTENLAFTYKQALQEIRDIVSEPCIVDENCQTCNSGCMQKDILAKINEVIGGE